MSHGERWGTSVDHVLFSSKSDGTDYVTGFNAFGSADNPTLPNPNHDLVGFSGSFNQFKKASDLDDAVNDASFQFIEGGNGVQNDSGVVIDLSGATATSSDDNIEAVVFSQSGEGVGSAVRFDDPNALAAFADEFSDELQLFADRGDDLLLICNAEFQTGPDMFAAFLYVEGSRAGANGIDPEIAGSELTCLGIFETDGNVTPDYFALV